MRRLTYQRAAWRGVSLTILVMLSASVAAQQNPAFKVETATQQARDNNRQQILLTELSSEQQGLAQAQQELAVASTAQQPPEKLAALQARVTGHLRNIEALNRELSAFNGRRATKPVVKAAPIALSKTRQPDVQEAEQAAQPAAPWWDVYARTRFNGKPK